MKADGRGGIAAVIGNSTARGSKVAYLLAVYFTILLGRDFTEYTHMVTQAYVLFSGAARLSERQTIVDQSTEGPRGTIPDVSAPLARPLRYHKTRLRDNAI